MRGCLIVAHSLQSLATKALQFLSQQIEMIAVKADFLFENLLTPTK